MKNVSNWKQRKTKNQHTYQSNYKLEKTPKCFKDHENSKCHKRAATLVVIIPFYGDLLAMVNQQLTKSRAEGQKYLKVVMECIHYLTCQGMPIRWSNHVNDNLTQLLIIQGEDNPAVLERISSASASKKQKYTHQDYQSKLSLWWSMRYYLSLIKLSKFFSIICNKYADVSRSNNYVFAFNGSMKSFVQWKTFFPIIKNNISNAEFKAKLWNRWWNHHASQVFSETRMNTWSTQWKHWGIK